MEQRGVLVAIVLGDIGTSADVGEYTNKEQRARGDKLAAWLETLMDQQPETEDFFNASLTLAEAAMNDTLEIG